MPPISLVKERKWDKLVNEVYSSARMVWGNLDLVTFPFSYVQYSTIWYRIIFWQNICRSKGYNFIVQESNIPSIIVVTKWFIRKMSKEKKKCRFLRWGRETRVNFLLYLGVADPHHLDAHPHHFDAMRIRILLFILMRIRILLFTLMRIRISLSVCAYH